MYNRSPSRGRGKADEDEYQLSTSRAFPATLLNDSSTAHMVSTDGKLYFYCPPRQSPDEVQAFAIKDTPQGTSAGFAAANGGASPNLKMYPIPNSTHAQFPKDSSQSPKLEPFAAGYKRPITGTPQPKMAVGREPEDLMTPTGKQNRQGGGYYNGYYC